MPRTLITGRFQFNMLDDGRMALLLHRIARPSRHERPLLVATMPAENVAELRAFLNQTTTQQPAQAAATSGNPAKSGPRTKAATPAPTPGAEGAPATS